MLPRVLLITIRGATLAYRCFFAHRSAWAVRRADRWRRLRVRVRVAAAFDRRQALAGQAFLWDHLERSNPVLR